MNTNAANQQIIRILEKALDLRSFVANQYLISNLVLQEEKFFTLSFQVMEAIPEIIAMRATSEDIASSVQLLKSFYFTTDYIFIPYQIFPRLLVLKQLNKIGDRLEIISYIKSLHGSESASIWIMMLLYLSTVMMNAWLFGARLNIALLKKLILQPKFIQNFMLIFKCYLYKNPLTFHRCKIIP